MKRFFLLFLLLTAAPIWAAQTDYTFTTDAVGTCPVDWLCESNPINHYPSVVADGADGHALKIASLWSQWTSWAHIDFSSGGYATTLESLTRWKVSASTSANYLVQHNYWGPCSDAVYVTENPSNATVSIINSWAFDDYGSCDGSSSFSDSFSFNVAADTWYQLRLRTTPTTACFKIWLDSGTEPGSWSCSSSYGGGSFYEVYFASAGFTQDRVVDWTSYSKDGSTVTAPGGSPPPPTRTHRIINDTSALSFTPGNYSRLAAMLSPGPMGWIDYPSRLKEAGYRKLLRLNRPQERGTR